MGKKKGKKIDLMKVDVPAVIEEVRKGKKTEGREIAVRILESAEKIKQLLMEEDDASRD